MESIHTILKGVTYKDGSVEVCWLVTKDNRKLSHPQCLKIRWLFGGVRRQLKLHK